MLYVLHGIHVHLMIIFLLMSTSLSMIKVLNYIHDITHKAIQVRDVYCGYYCLWNFDFYHHAINCRHIIKQACFIHIFVIMVLCKISCLCNKHPQLSFFIKFLDINQGKDAKNKLRNLIFFRDADAKLTLWSTSWFSYWWKKRVKKLPRSNHDGRKERKIERKEINTTKDRWDGAPCSFLFHTEGKTKWRLKPKFQGKKQLRV